MHINLLVVFKFHSQARGCCFFAAVPDCSAACQAVQQESHLHDGADGQRNCTAHWRG